MKSWSAPDPGPASFYMRQKKVFLRVSCSGKELRIFPVIPGLTRNPVIKNWIPAFAGMTIWIPAPRPPST